MYVPTHSKKIIALSHSGTKGQTFFLTFEIATIFWFFFWHFFLSFRFFLPPWIMIRMHMEHKCRFWFPDPNHTNCNLLRIKAYLKLTLSHAAFWLVGFNIFTIIYSYQHTGADCHTRCSLCHTLCAFSFAFHHQPISAGLISDVCWHWFPLSPPSHHYFHFIK